MEVEDYIKSDVKYEPMGTCIYFSSKDIKEQKLLDIRGWGYLSTTYGEKQAEIIQDKIGFFVAEAINEKLDRIKKLNNNIKEV